MRALLEGLTALLVPLLVGGAFVGVLVLCIVIRIAGCPIGLWAILLFFVWVLGATLIGDLT